MKVRGKADIEAAFECNFGFLSFCLAGFQIIIDGTVKIVQKFLGTFGFVRNQRTNPFISSTLKHVVSCFMNWYTPISSNRKESVPIQPTKHSGLVSKGWRMQSVPKQDISI